jgi:hypothetical protein
MGACRRMALMSALFIVLAASHAFSCSCVYPGSIRTRVDNSDLAFEGELMSSSTDTALQKVHMVFKVRKLLGDTTWAKRIPFRIETRLYGATCGIEWPAGKNSIIFAGKRIVNSKEVFETSLCSGNILNPDKQQLDSLWVLNESKSYLWKKPDGKKKPSSR